MKKITTLIAMACVSSFGFAQSQRLVLHEEFTQASCGPCAAANPYYNALLVTNNQKVVSIKYQTSWPGVDPMNAQNAAQINSRTSTYYAVQGVPDGKQDGVDFYPGNITQGTIDAEYNVPSPFTIQITHSYNTAMDSVFATAVITCTQNVSMTTPKFRFAMVERQISFATAPGTNGEKDFYNVMRKMYPSEAGQTIATSWTTNQTQTLTFAMAIPSYIYNKGEIGFVGFIQDDANKNVKQAGWSAPVATLNDAGITAIAGLSTGSCSTTFTPTVTLQNFGSATLTSCTINYKIDNNAVQTYNWTGSLAPNATTTQALPQQTTTVGGHTFYAYTSSPNGGTDYDAINNQTKQLYVVLNSTANPFPYVQAYSTSAFPPTNWINFNPDGGVTWARAATVGAYNQAPLGSAKMDFYNNPAGNMDIMYAPTTNMSAVTGNSYLTFDVAHAVYGSPYIDTLEVLVSTDCGNTWTSVYNKYGTTLSTAPSTTSAFTPTANQWRNESISMNAFNGQGAVIVAFRSGSGYGNNLYIDNINLSNSNTGVYDMMNNVSLNVYPNPASTSATISLNLGETSPVTISVFNMLGENVKTINAGNLGAGAHDINLDASSLKAGVYFVKVSAGNANVSRKLVIEK